ncbi:Arc family DNA-binding protein [Marinobacter sp. MW3]|nr:Arc family DNA-binding protein [Marinobacter sp. MC3]MBL3893617.1 Arc family DNA-binding protein [Marinobacter sp. MW3]
MRERIRIAAEKSGRSMNAEIVSRLEESFQAQETLDRFNMMSVTLDEKLEKVRKEIDQMEKSKSEASEFIEQIKALTNRKVKED